MKHPVESKAIIVSGGNKLWDEINVDDLGEGDDDVVEIPGDTGGDVHVEDGTNWGELGVWNDMKDDDVVAVGMPGAISGRVEKGGQYRESPCAGPWKAVAPTAGVIAGARGSANS